MHTLLGVGKVGKANNTGMCIRVGIPNARDVISPSDNADMSNEKGTTPRLKLMVFSIK